MSTHFERDLCLSRFFSKLGEEKKEELDYISKKLNINLTKDNIDIYKQDIEHLLYSCYKGEIDKENKIKWITYGYIYGKNRKLEDWLPSVKILFNEYDDLDKKIPPNKKIKFDNYDDKIFNGGLSQLEYIVGIYKKDKKNYKIQTKTKEIDFSLHKDEVDKTLSYIYKDPNTEKNIFEVIVPTTVESSVYWGWNTKWCTSRKDPKDDDVFRENAFLDYYENTFIKRLYIIKIKGEIKYQIHFNTFQFMNVNNEEFSPKINRDKEEIKLIEEWIFYMINTISLTSYEKGKLLTFSSIFVLFNIIRFLINDFDINYRDVYKEKTCLFYASTYGNLEVVKYLIEKGADVNILDKFGCSCLTYAVMYGKLEVVKYLIEKGADVNIRDKTGRTCLFSASDLEIFKYLIEKGADVNRDKRGYSILIIASIKGHLEIVKYFIEKGEDVNSKDEAGNTILMLACFTGHLEIVKYLIDKGADVNTKDEVGNTCLMISCFTGHLEMVKYLIEKGADVNIRNNNGDTCLILANKKNHKEIVNVLLKM